jgi:aminopeptidase N
MKTPPFRLCAFARVILFCFLLASAALATRVERRIDTWQPTHYDISITLNDALSEITTATARIHIRLLKPTRVIDLDFGDLTVDRVSFDSTPLTFTHKDGKLLIDLPTTRDEMTLTIVYHGKPKDGLLLTADKYGKPAAVGDNWPNRVHQWIPTFDHPSAKAKVTFTITAPAGQEVVANGRLDHVETTASGQRTWTYSEGVPIPPYCMVIAVGQFARLEPTERAITPLLYYVPLAERDLAVKGFSPAGPSLEFFSQNVAPYPYEKLALIVGATRFGGMENSSAIVFTSNLFSRAAPRGPSKTFGVPLNNVNVIAHEIAHQWFGDSVTESTWSDLWLSEGFATYFAGLFVQRYEGEDAFQTYLKDAAATVFRYEKEKRVPIFDRDTEDLMALLNANNYQKGAWVLHMLRARLGDFSFYRGIRAYYNEHKNSTATTEDLRRALERVSGKDLRGFFTRWVYETGHPQYELSWEWSRGRQLRLVLKQTQAGAVFLDPVPVVITTPTGKRDLVLKPANKQLVQTISLGASPVRVEVDPGNTLLKEATVKAL